MNLQALAPEYQELREIDAIKNDAQVQNYLEKLNARITNIYKSAIDGDRVSYTVETNSLKKFDVNIVYTHENTMPGPQTFKVIFTKPEWDMNVAHQ